MKGKKILIAAIALIIIAGSIGGLYYLQNYEKFYYSQIDNSNLKKLSDDSDMKYEYTLNCWDKKGKKKKLKFKTSRELKEDAYILLTVRSAGVHAWEEVQYDELPEAVQEKID